MFASIQRINMGATTVIGSVPLRNIADSGDSNGAKGQGGVVPSAGDSFRVSSAISVLFAKLPANLKDHVAFRHFYTDELDAGAHALCIKYFSLFVLYFCTVFRLEGRRRHYLEQPTERSGREFAAAHKRAQVVFQELSTVYGTILMRYNRHSEIRYTARHAIMVKGRTSGKSFTRGVKNASQQLLEECEKAFKFESEDFLFYEHLSAFALQIVKLAFAEDTNMQEKALHQVSEMFRSKSYTFNPQRRRVEVTDLERQLDSDSVSIKENTFQIAELLTPHDPKIIVKFANQQRTPFVQTRYPGGTSFMKYQRPKGLKGTKEGATAVEKQFTVESEQPTFPLEHPAMYRIRVWQARKKEREVQKKRLQMATGLTPEPTAIGNSAPVTDHRRSTNIRTPESESPISVPAPNMTDRDQSLGLPPNGATTARPQNGPLFASRQQSGMQGTGGVGGATRKESGPNNSNLLSTPLLLPVVARASSTTGGDRSTLGTPHRLNKDVGTSYLANSNALNTSNQQGATALPLLASRMESMSTTHNPRSTLLGTSTHIGIELTSGNPFDLAAGASNGVDVGSNNADIWGATGRFGSGAEASILGNTQSLTSPKSAKSEADRLELEEREAKFYEIFHLPRLFSTHAVTHGLCLDVDSREAVALAAAAHYQALAIAENSNTHHLNTTNASTNANSSSLAGAGANAAKSRMGQQSPSSSNIGSGGNIMALNDFIPTGPLTQADYKAALATVIESWATFDLTQEIDAVYQAVANGVVVKDLSLPRDIMLRYDEQGILYVNEKDGSPMTVS